MTATAKIEDLVTPVGAQLGDHLNSGHTALLLPDSQQAVFDHLIDRLSAPSTRLALIGHAGMGKSTLLRELAFNLRDTCRVLAPATPYSSFDEFSDAVTSTGGMHEEQQPSQDAVDICNSLSEAGTPLVLLIDNALAWPPFLLIELAVLSRTSDLRLVFSDRPGLTPHTETLGVEDSDVLELVPFTRAEMDRFAEQRLVNPASGDPRILRQGASDRIWYYTGGLPHLGSLLCDKLIPGDADDMDMPVTANLVDIIANDIGLTEREYLDSISAANNDLALGEGTRKKRVMTTLNHISLMAASISALAVVSIVVALQYSQPQDLTREGVVWGDQPVERLAEEFASLGGTLDQPLIEAVDNSPGKLISDPLTSLSSPEKPTKLSARVTPLLAGEPAMVTENLITGQGEPDTVLVALDLTQLLEKATEHMTAHRYTVPSGENAFELYSQILAKDPTNDQAVDGVRNIHSLYINWGREAMKKHEWKKATGHFRKAHQVLPGHQQTKILLKEAETRVFWLLTFKTNNTGKTEDRLPKREVKANDYEWMDKEQSN